MQPGLDAQPQHARVVGICGPCPLALDHHFERHLLRIVRSRLCGRVRGQLAQMDARQHRRLCTHSREHRHAGVGRDDRDVEREPVGLRPPAGPLEQGLDVVRGGDVAPPSSRGQRSRAS